MPETSPDPAALGRAVRAIRAEKGLSQVQLSDNTGLQRAWLSNLEHGRRNPNFVNVVRLATGLGIRPSELVARAEALARHAE
jgi:transcriptional regulator with XRE-family HTH domain